MMLKVFAVLACLVPFISGQIVTLPQGQLQGKTWSSGTMHNVYLAFKGIPYAEPPVGPLRFRNPVPHRGWTGVLDATEHRGVCPSRAAQNVIGTEDCLYLNVYTQSLATSRPVMVWVHGGAFILGDGNSGMYGPDLFINEGGVVVVTFNYRLGIFGFLSTNDANAQGNWAMKDMIEALRWVRENIHHFGGNPNQITVFGESAGSVGVHYLLLTQLGAGLFHRAIMQSGTANCPWAFQPNPLAEAIGLAQRIGLSWSNTQDLLVQLRNLPMETIMMQQNGLMDMAVPRGFQSFAWVPSVEPINSPEYRFLVDTPVNLMNRGQILTMPFIIGYTDIESLFMIRETLIDDTVFDQFAVNPHFYVPQSYNLNPVQNVAQINEVATTFRDMYLGGAHPSDELRFNWTIYNTDHHFHFFVDRSVRYHARRQSQAIYYYKFSYDGAFNLMKRRMLLGAYPGAMHADDLSYLFEQTSLPVVPNASSLTTRRRMVRLWTNFAVFGDPTVITDSLVPTRWNRYTLANEEYLDVQENLVLLHHPNNGRLHQWHTFQDRFNPSYPT